MNSSLFKGTLDTLILKLLSDRGQMYGYEIIKALKEASHARVEVKEGALYPALHKLEQKGFLETSHRTVSGRLRKYYRLSTRGKKASQERVNDLQEAMQAIKNILTPQTLS